MINVRAIFILILGFWAGTCGAQDVLLLNNGRYKKLKGTVVYYDNSNILYQNKRQKKQLENYERKEEARQKALKSSEKWQQKQAKKAAKLQKNHDKQQARIERRKLIFEDEKKTKEAALTPADYETWKNREEARIKQLETELGLKEALAKNVEEIQAKRTESLKRGRFTSDVSRQRVFSIIRPDGSEEVVYNADTLGILADGEPDLEYGAEEMRMYIKGRQDGRKHSFHDVYIGAGVGLLSSLALTWTWDVFYAPIPPAVCVIVMATAPLKIKSKTPEVIEKLWHPAYRDGYERSARGRKIFAFTIGAVGGLAVGSTVAVFTSPLLR